MLVVFLIGLLALLQGCGGGSGGKTNVRPDTAPSAAQRVTYEGGTTVEIAVLDSEFLVAHREFEGLKLTTFNPSGDDSDMGRSEQESATNLVDHGTPVAALVAGRTYGYSPSTDLLLYRVSRRDDGATTASAITEGLRLAAAEGARVINASYTGAQRFLNDRELAAMIGPAEGSKGAVITVAAGNSGASLSEDWRIDDFVAADTLAVLGQTLIVGGSHNGDRASRSNYPGEQAWIQDRFLLAPFVAESASGSAVDATGTFAGTSFAAPIVAGMVGAILGRWPHLDAVQVSQLMLETAARDSGLYRRNDCGPDQNANCGLYYLGQGFADLGAAMQPTGELEVASGDHLDDGGVTLACSQIAWSSAFAGMLPAGALQGAVAFDDLGRDYQLDLAALQGQHGLYRSRLRERQEIMLQTSPAARSVTSALAPGVSLTTLAGPASIISGNRVQLDSGRVAIGAFGFQQGDTRLIDAGSEPWGIALLADREAATTHSLDQGIGVDLSLVVTDSVSLKVQHWQASAVAETGGGAGRYRQARDEAAVQVAVLPLLSFELGWAQRHEDNGVLGSRSAGALDLGPGLTMTQWLARATLEMGEHAQLVARYERGSGGDVGGEGLIRSLSGLETTSYQLGLLVGRDRHRGVLAVSSPLRVTRGVAHLDVPVGRDLDGHVLREARQASMSADGRQTDVELGYAYRASSGAALQVNLLHTREPDHVRKAEPETAFTMVYSRPF